MDLKLQVKQSQILSQRMIQSAEILQMTSQELNTYVNDLALENPVIDIVEPVAGNDQKESIEQQQWLNSFNEENYYLYQRQNNDDDYDFKDTWNINTDEGETLADYLWSQKTFLSWRLRSSISVWTAWTTGDISLKRLKILPHISKQILSLLTIS